MVVLDICSGTGSSSKGFVELGYEVFTIDINPDFKPSLVADITKINPDDLPTAKAIVFAPPCEKLSITANNRGHWVKDYDRDIITPISEVAHRSVEIVNTGLNIINNQIERNPDVIYFIENPTGKMRKLEIMQPYNRDSVCYCQYGDCRMKPTDFWHNSKVWFPRPMCKPCRDPGLIKEIDGIEWVFYYGKMCHQRAQRPINAKDKSKQKGTMGLKTYEERSMWPYQLSYEIAMATNKELGLMGGYA